MVSVPDPEVTGLQWSFIVNVSEVQASSRVVWSVFLR